MPCVSVVIPTFNRAALLRLAIETALRQTFRDFEVLVVDDGSTDDTPAVAHEYDGRIRYFRQPNRGVNAARNVAVRQARGEYIALLDSDDLWLPYALQLMAGLLGRFPDAGFVYADFLILRGDAPPFGPGLSSWHKANDWTDIFSQKCNYRELDLPPLSGLDRNDFNVYSGDIYDASLHGAQVPTSSSLIRRSRMQELEFPEFDSLCGDWEFFARLSRRHGAVYADVPAMLNRSHEDAVRLTRVPSAIQLEKRIALIDRLWRQDSEFMSQRGTAVDARQFDLLLALARNRLMQGDHAAAQAALARAAPMRGNHRTMQWLGLRTAVRLPGSELLLRAIRAARHWLWQARHGAAP